MTGGNAEGRSIRRDTEHVQRFLAYLEAFNADLEAVERHVTEDVVFEWGEVMSPPDGLEPVPRLLHRGVGTLR